MSPGFDEGEAAKIEVSGLDFFLFSFFLEEDEGGRGGGGGEKRGG